MLGDRVHFFKEGRRSRPSTLPDHQVPELAEGWFLSSSKGGTTFLEMQKGRKERLGIVDLILQHSEIRSL